MSAEHNVEYVRPTRTITDIYEKQGRSGPLIFVDYAVRVETEAGELVMEETRRRIFR